MEETNRQKTNYLRLLVKDRPLNYDEEKNKIINYITYIVNDNAADVLLEYNYADPYTRLARYIYNLPNSLGWKRKHIYLLINELINFYEDEVLDFLYDVETGIDGNCDTNGMDKYQDEPKENDEFRQYIRKMYWLK